MNSFYTQQELDSLGLKSHGSNVLISKKASLYNPSDISIGDNVRIDDFCILSGTINIGNRVHISASSKLYGAATIEFQDYSGCSANCIIYSETDDFSGEALVGPMVDIEQRRVISGKVTLEKYSQLGANTVVMPATNIGTGTVTGALTFVNQSLEPWGVYVGIPCRRIKDRNHKMIDLL